MAPLGIGYPLFMYCILKSIMYLSVRQENLGLIEIVSKLQKRFCTPVKHGSWSKAMIALTIPPVNILQLSNKILLSSLSY